MFDPLDRNPEIQSPCCIRIYFTSLSFLEEDAPLSVENLYPLFFGIAVWLRFFLPQKARQYVPTLYLNGRESFLRYLLSCHKVHTLRNGTGEISVDILRTRRHYLLFTREQKSQDHLEINSLPEGNSNPEFPLAIYLPAIQHPVQQAQNFLTAGPSYILVEGLYSRTDPAGSMNWKADLLIDVVSHKTPWVFWIWSFMVDVKLLIRANRKPGLISTATLERWWIPQFCNALKNIYSEIVITHVRLVVQRKRVELIEVQVLVDKLIHHLTILSSLFCCTTIKPYRPCRLNHEANFTPLIAWAAFPKISSPNAGNAEEVHLAYLKPPYAVKPVCQINYDPLENKSYFNDLIHANFQKLNAYVIISCILSDSSSSRTCTRKALSKKHHWYANNARLAILIGFICM
ncbi:uncharacterized protein BDR25DRAFT_390670 [Lindgomyces ingoldianus]|uniref:Uncharacterized protein n=1 Tax=Lindgomyces ingoldianus TaxID=673940 RepID=A0ACB6RD10_9PLEO|nr:uncharacterized protein BDR25DRAFT_390670 [Lindgomyces ingoldianus]KAF2476987.1 hypothetical protein BDR25DRAFT_390670 [Lindgomyces ingoldianus]